MILITNDPVDPLMALQAVADANAGANLLFLGTTRQWTGKTRTVELRYECYQAMAERELQALCSEARARWKLNGVAVIHRIGTVPPGQASLAVAVSSPHRQESFEAGQWLIDAIKQVVPVWKQEVDHLGNATWIHPQATGTSADSVRREPDTESARGRFAVPNSGPVSAVRAGAPSSHDSGTRAKESLDRRSESS